MEDDFIGAIFREKDTRKHWKVVDVYLLNSDYEIRPIRNLRHDFLGKRISKEKLFKDYIKVKED